MNQGPTYCFPARSKILAALVEDLFFSVHNNQASPSTNTLKIEHVAAAANTSLPYSYFFSCVMRLSRRITKLLFIPVIQRTIEVPHIKLLRIPIKNIECLKRKEMLQPGHLDSYVGPFCRSGPSVETGHIMAISDCEALNDNGWGNCTTGIVRDGQTLHELFSTSTARTQYRIWYNRTTTSPLQHFSVSVENLFSSNEKCQMQTDQCIWSPTGPGGDQIQTCPESSIQRERFDSQFGKLM